MTPELWAKLGGIKTKTSGFTLGQAIACAVQFDDQHCGIYAGDGDSYKDFAEVFDPIIEEYHGLPKGFKHTSDMDADKIKGNIDSRAPAHSTRIRVGRSIEGFGLSPGITKNQRLEMEDLMKSAFSKLSGDLAGKYYPLLGMAEADRQQLVDDHFLFISGDKNLIAAGMERDWPEGRGIFHNAAKTFLVWVNEEDQLRIISMQKGKTFPIFNTLYFFFREIKAVNSYIVENRCFFTSFFQKIISTIFARNPTCKTKKTSSSKCCAFTNFFKHFIFMFLSGGDVRGVFERLARGIKAVGDSVEAESGKKFMLDEKLGYLHSCPTNLGTGMRASVHVDLPGWTKEGLSSLKARCEELALQPRGTRGESGGQTGVTYDISNKHRLGYSEVQLVQTMIDGVNTLYVEDLALQKKHGLK